MMHQPNQAAKCHICQKVFRNAEYRDNHQRKSHGITAALIKNAIPPPTSEMIQNAMPNSDL